MNKIIFTKSTAGTKKIASNLACQVLRFAPKPGFGAIVIGLIGDLGSGKTTFTQGCAKRLGIKKIITSPTFVLEKIYELPGKKHRHFVHIDAYRIDDSKELIDMGFKDLIKNKQNLILIEWADKIKSILPKDCIKINFSHKGKDKRKIVINSKSKSW